jgi:hypothetical protein
MLKMQIREIHVYAAMVIAILAIFAYSLYSKEFFFLMTQFFVLLNVPVSSYGKLAAFLGILIALIIFMAARKSLKINGSMRNYSIALILIVSLLVTTSAVNSLCYLKYANLAYRGYFNDSYGYEDFLNRLELQFISFNGESTHYYSTEKTAHSHQTRSFIFLLLKTFGLNRIVSADIGEGVYGFQTNGEMAIIFLLSAASIAALLYLTKNYVGLISAKRKGIAHKIIITFAYSIAVFHIMHALFDGGILASFWIDASVSIVLVTLLLRHYANDDKRMLYLFLIIIVISPAIYSVAGIGAKYVFGTGLNIATQSIAMIRKVNSFILLMLVFLSSPKYKIKKLWLKDYFVLILATSFVFAATPTPYFKNWSIYDPVIEHDGDPVYFGPNKITELVTFENPAIPPYVEYEKYTIGRGLNIFYLLPGKGFDAKSVTESLKKIVGGVNGPLRSLNFTFGDHSYSFYILFDNRLNNGNKSYSVRNETAIDGMHLYFISGKFHAYSYSHAAYIIGKDTNSKAIIIYLNKGKGGS